jgi:sterol desaturase/sphingolipid hydroxylase (fatty acid hydroxylase superfamily)
MNLIARNIVSYGLYPCLLLLTVAAATYTILFDWDLKVAYTWMAASRFTFLLALEFLLPLKAEWRMTRRSFFRDAKFMASGALVTRAIRFLLVLAAIDLSQANSGLLPESNIVVGFVLTALTYEFLQYWFHRISHEAKGTVGRWLWQVHVAHHLPDGLYLVMHAVRHPLGLVFSFVVMQIALISMGASQQSIFLLNSLMGLHGLISHFNVDLKAGFLNYVFVGPELHRFHHSAAPEESLNYGVLTPFWDVVFGTFYYRPGCQPQRLGVASPSDYPQSQEFWKVLALPFKRQASKPVHELEARI